LGRGEVVPNSSPAGFHLRKQSFLREILKQRPIQKFFEGGILKFFVWNGKFWGGGLRSFFKKNPRNRGLLKPTVLKSTPKFLKYKKNENSLHEIFLGIPQSPLNTHLNDFREIY